MQRLGEPCFIFIIRMLVEATYCMPQGLEGARFYLALDSLQDY